MKITQHIFSATTGICGPYAKYFATGLMIALSCMAACSNVLADVEPQNQQSQKKQQSQQTPDDYIFGPPSTPHRPSGKKPVSGKRELGIRWQILTLDKQKQEHAVDPSNYKVADGSLVRLRVQFNQDGYGGP